MIRIQFGLAVILGLVSLAGVFAPLIYLAYGSYFWLRNGIWYDGNLCSLIGTISECSSSSKYLGVAKIADWLSTHPFFALVLLGGVFYLTMFDLAKAIGDDAHRKLDKKSATEKAKQ